jgi:hypothetical protein
MRIKCDVRDYYDYLSGFSTSDTVWKRPVERCYEYIGAKRGFELNRQAVVISKPSISQGPLEAYYLGFVVRVGTQRVYGMAHIEQLQTQLRHSNFLKIGYGIENAYNVFLDLENRCKAPAVKVSVEKFERMLTNATDEIDTKHWKTLLQTSPVSVSFFKIGNMRWSYDRNFYHLATYTNPILDAMKFGKVMPPEIIYNELYKEIATNGNQEPTIPELSNDDRIVQHGFNVEQSFRRVPRT